MANSISAFVKQRYTKTVQALLQERLIAMDVADTTLLAQMPDGNTINYPRPTYSQVGAYVKYTDVTDQDVVATSETLVINETPIISFVFDTIDQEEVGWDVVGVETKNVAFRIKKYLEGKLFNQYQYFNNTYNGGTATALSTSNAVATFTNAYATLANAGVDTDNIVLVTDEFARAVISQTAATNRYELGDDAFKRGFTGEKFAGMAYYTANNLTCVGSIALATQPTAGDYVTYNGVKFTFVASIGTTAGNVLLGADAAAARANLIAALNGASGAGTTYVEVSKENRSKLFGLTASESSTSVVFTSLAGFRPVAKSMTAAGNKFGQFVIYAMAFERGSIKLVLRDNVQVKVQDVPKQLAQRWMTWSRFGLKVFSEGAERGIIIPVEAKAAE